MTYRSLGVLTINGEELVILEAFPHEVFGCLGWEHFERELRYGQEKQPITVSRYGEVQISYLNVKLKLEQQGFIPLPWSRKGDGLLDALITLIDYSLYSPSYHLIIDEDACGFRCGGNNKGMYVISWSSYPESTCGLKESLLFTCKNNSNHT